MASRVLSGLHRSNPLKYPGALFKGSWQRPVFPFAPALMGGHVPTRWFGASAGALLGARTADGDSLSKAGTEALASIKASVNASQKPIKKLQLTKKERKNVRGNVGKYVIRGDRPEFHNVDRDPHGRIFEPTDSFEVVISSSKNNCWMTVVNKARNWRTVFHSSAGNVGYRKGDRKTSVAAFRVAENIARKLRRLGVVCASVRFRKLMKVEPALQAFHAQGLRVLTLTHEPRLPKGLPTKARKRRRV